MPLWVCLRQSDGQAGPKGSGLRPLALAMLQYSPHVACFRQDSVVLEVAASLALFGGPLALCRRIRHATRHQHADWRLGMAPSATGAWLLAGIPGTARRRVLRVDSLARLLAPLPLQALPETHTHQAWLEGLACRTLGKLRNLPRQGLRQRSSSELLPALDHAYAQTPETLAWFQPPARFHQSQELDFHLHHADALLTASQSLLQSLCGWLQNRQAALHSFALVAHHEKGRQACSPTRFEVRFSAASWRLEEFNRLLKESLQHGRLQRAAIKLELIAGPPSPRAPANDSLFPDPSRYAQDEQRLLDLLAARLGRDTIRRPRPQAQHLPEQANLWAAELAPPASQSLPVSVGVKPRPFWLLPQPLPLVVQQERPFYQGRPLRLAHGPERLETGWHSGYHERRDYFVAEDPDGARYWIYRERETGANWLLHGLFA